MPFRLFFQQKRHYKTLCSRDITSYLKYFQMKKQVLNAFKSLLAETKTRQKKKKITNNFLSLYNRAIPCF